jgi:hypothetical protein
MMSTLRRTVRYGLVLVSALLALFVVSQVAQLVALSRAVHPGFGAIVALLLIGGIAWLVAVPLLAYRRLEPALVPPVEPTRPEHEAYVAAYLAACKRNPLLEDLPLATEAHLESALRALEKEAERIGNRYASQVFLGTAMSQYGSLDAIIVGASQARMVWEIAHVFQRRPSARHLGYLYGNVLATTLVASRLQNVDLSEYVRPILTSVMGEAVAAVPGVVPVSGHLSRAMFVGSVNAFLTLRVAMVAIAYSKATVRPDRAVVWQNAVLRAGSLVVRTVADGSAQVSKAFAIAAAKSVRDAATGAGKAAIAGGQAVSGAVVSSSKAAVAGGQAVTRAVVSSSQAAGAAVLGAAKSVGAAADQAAEAVQAAGHAAAAGAHEAAEGIMSKLRREQHAGTPEAAEAAERPPTPTQRWRGSRSAAFG